MTGLGFETLQWIKAAHVMAVIAWMAGLFYLPRLFVYHRDVAPGSEPSELFKIMERRLLKAITTPAMMASVALGVPLVLEMSGLPVWLVAKLLGVVALIAFHIWMAGFQKAFARDERPGSSRLFRLANEIPTAHYNTLVDRASVPRVDWNSAEHMREVRQYELGVIVGYNAGPPATGRGSCIFLHVWTGPQSHTAGCTAFDGAKLRDVTRWLDPKKRPLLVQLTAKDYANLRIRWRLP